MKSIFNLLMLAGPQRPMMVAAIVLRVFEGLVAALPLGIVLITAARILDPHAFPSWPAGLAMAALLLAAALTAQWALFHAASRCGHLVGYRMTARLRRDLIVHLRRLPSTFFHKRDSGDITGIVMGDVTRLEMFPGVVLPRVVLGTLFPILGVVIGLMADWRLALPLAVAVALLPLALTAATAIQDNAASRLTDAGNALNSRVLEFILALPVLKAFGLTARHLTGCVQAMAAARDCGKALTTRYVLAAMLVPLLVAAAGSLTIVLAFLSLRDGTIDSLRFLLFVFLTLRLFAPVIELVEFSSIIQQMALSAERLTAILTAPPQQTQAAARPTADHSIRFENVGMVHGDGTVALHGIDLAMAQGSVTALVGHTGSGKSTIARLITRFWEASSGRVTIGGVDVRSLDPEILAGMVGVVSQQVVLFTMSVRDNLRLARPGASDAEIEAAARKARCHEMIRALPQGYDTVLDNGGAVLSGGERQRLSLARLFLKDCPILVLDEATSALDVENEHLVQQALAELIIGRTVVMIAHRLWTVRHADQIVVLDNGRITQCGTHGELVEQLGPYGGLWRALEEAPGWRRL